MQRIYIDESEKQAYFDIKMLQLMKDIENTVH